MTDTTDTQPLRQELERQQESKGGKTVLDLLERQRPEIEKALPAGISAERFTRTVLTEIRRTPKLLECSPDSLLGALMLSAQLGLEPGPLGHVYFVPFKREVTFIVGYRGMVDLAYRSGLLKSVAAATVREGDAFDFRLGSRPYLDHLPTGPPAKREPTHYYAVADLKTGGKPFVVLYPDDVEAARKRSPAARQDAGPWITDYGRMAEKTAVRRLARLLPQSPQLSRALAVDETPVESIEAVSDAEAEGADGEV